jgi:hypothetical protein
MVLLGLSDPWPTEVRLDQETAGENALADLSPTQVNALDENSRSAGVT